MSVAAVIVTYNRKAKLRCCIDALLRQTGSVMPDIIVVDNNSSDGTDSMMKEYSGTPGIVYHRLLLNSGGAGGFAYGLRRAVEAGYDHVWLMDDDCVPADDALAEFMKYDSLHHGEYGFLSSRILWKDGSLCEMNVQRETVFRDIPAGKLSEGSTPSEVAMASFVSLFIPSHVVYDVGLPIREFFLWTDDWEYTRRISLKYPCMVIPTSVAVHNCDANAGADISKADKARLDRFRYLYRNDVYLYRREGIRGFGYEAARLAVHMGRVMLNGRSLKEKRSMIGTIVRGTAEGLSFYPCIDRVKPKS